MSQVRIYQPTKNAMQSGRAKLGGWVLEHEPCAATLADPLMGWIGSDDTRGQVRLGFETRDEAVAFAKRNGLNYTITEPKVRRVKPKDYSANFAYDRIR
ncbi:MAG: ETC complex I subunit [Rhodospirillaceae bacterium]|nr:ETC complex I subunit [Rhodospirillaceae bacterium]MBL6940700.1 ETC complex I subunit [Rhodospirillales bacterium]